MKNHWIPKGLFALAFALIVGLAWMNEFPIVYSEESLLSTAKESAVDEVDISQLKITEIENSPLVFVQYKEDEYEQIMLYEVNDQRNKLKMINESYGWGGEMNVQNVHTKKGIYTVISGNVSQEYVRFIQLTTYNDQKYREFPITPGEPFAFAFPNDNDVYYDYNYLDMTKYNVNIY